MMTSYTLPQLTYADEIDPPRYRREDIAPLAEISAAWDAYYGVNQETLRPAKNEPHSVPSTDNVALNFAQFIVDTSTFFLSRRPAVRPRHQHRSQRAHAG